MQEQLQPPLQSPMQRFERWVHDIETSCGVFHAHLPRNFDRQSFYGDVRPVANQGFRSSSLVITNCPRVYRGPQDIRDDDQDFFYLLLQQEGRAQMSQADQHLSMRPGDLVLLDVSKSSEFLYAGISRQLSIILPRQMMSDIYRGSPVQTGVKIESGSRLAGLLQHFINSAFEPGLNELDEMSVLESLCTLLKPVAMPTRMEISMSGHGSDLLHKAIRVIESNLDQGRLTAAEICRELNVSERTLHRAFARFGHTFAGYVLDRRLERSARSLVHQRGMPISRIADVAGFADISHFSHSFKRRFGMSPRAYRAQHD